MNNKTLLLTLAAGLLVGFTACKKEEVKEEKKAEKAKTSISIERKQVPILFKITGETCFYCGDWGWQAWINLSDKYKGGKGFCWSNYGEGFSNGYFRSKEINPTMNILENMFEVGGGKPNFGSNGVDFSTSYANAGKDADAKMGETAKVSAGMEASIDGDKLTIKTAAKFYENMDGDYYIGAYLVEDKVKATQSGQSGIVEHHLVMRGSLSSSAWGVNLATNAKADDVIENEFSVTIPDGYNKDNFSYGVIIWKKDGSKYSYVNAFTNQ